jgi:hypothetical protein
VLGNSLSLWERARVRAPPEKWTQRPYGQYTYISKVDDVELLWILIQIQL